MLASSYIYILIFLQAASCTFVLSPFCYPLAKKIGAIDVPLDSRRMHTEPVPRVCGFAVFFAFVFNFSIFGEFDSYMQSLFFGGLLISVLGLFDDSFGLSPKVKLFFQCLSGAFVFIFGISFPIFKGNIKSFPFLLLSMILTVSFTVALENSFNLIDGIDGLCGKTSLYASVALFLVGLMSKNTQGCIIALCIGGCAFGFLPHNLYPPKQFLGDTGALFFGFALSVCALQITADFGFLLAFLTVALIFAYPFAETASSFLRRAIKGQNPFSPDKNHFHHRLVAMGFSKQMTANLLSLISLLSGLFAVLLCSYFI